MGRLTKAQRIEEKVNEGMTRLEAEIEVEQEDFQARIEKLKAEQEEEQRKINEKMLDLLEEEHPDIHAKLKDRVIADKRAEEIKRSRRARTAARNRRKKSSDGKPIALPDLPDQPDDRKDSSGGFSTHQS